MIRLVLAERVTADDVDDLVVGAGLLLLNLLRATDVHPTQAIYRTRDRQALVYVINDARAPSILIIVQGPAEAAVAAIVRAGVPFLSEEIVAA
jgi:hypothetical protein